jgi:tripartite-type tricarboxylate transporter receptor subunit TctC
MDGRGKRVHGQFNEFFYRVIRMSSFIQRAGLMLSLSCLLSSANAQNTNNAWSPVEKALASDKFTIVAPFPPGGPVDVLARMLAEGLQKIYSQTALVENLPGAQGNLGMDKVKKAKPDGHTLLVIPAGNLTINPTLMKNFPFQIDRDFAAITMIAKAPNVMVASAQVQVKNVKELLELARLKPNTLSYASPGIGSGLHLAGELFKQQTGVDMLHVPYKGTAPALNDVLGGSIPLMFSNLPATLPHIRSGKLVALGITDSVRSSVAPDLPTLQEQGVKGVVVTSWYGLLASSGTPAEVTSQLAKDAVWIFTQPPIKDQLKAQGLSEVLQKPDEFASYIAQETLTWAKIIRSKHIEAE